MNEGKKSEAFAEATASYASFEEAIRHFGAVCKITDWHLHFSEFQTLLFKDLP